jgi:hypothetical protein
LDPGGILCRKARTCPSYWTVEKVNVVRFYQKYRRGKIIRLQENKKLLSDALLDENHISPEIEENLDFILDKNLLLQ